jgi:hypothetical protein
MRHTIAMMMVLLAIGLSTPIASGQAQRPAGPPPKSPNDNRLSFGSFSVDYPKKDWQVLGGTGSSIVVFVHKSRDATVAVERTKIAVPLAPNEIVDQTAALEIEEWQARRPLSAGYSHQIFDAMGARSIVIDFNQPGPAGAEHVRMYTMPRGADWFRVVCTTAQRTFDTYKETCHRIALSLAATTP